MPYHPTSARELEAIVASTDCDFCHAAVGERCRKTELGRRSNIGQHVSYVHMARYHTSTLDDQPDEDLNL